jgi:uncharacterized membrane protein YfhO
VAILETAPPPLDPPSGPSASVESVSLTNVDAAHLQLNVDARAAGLVVASEIAYPAWHATLDGQPVPILTADGALRAISVPAGQHVIEMRYQSPALAAGLGMSAFTAAILVAVAILHSALHIRSRDGSGEVRCKTGAVPQL